MKNLVTLALCLIASAAAACPVCGQGKPESEWAYIAMTMVMSLLPIALIGGIGGFFVYKLKAADREEAAAIATAPAVAVGEKTPSGV